jgi:hypothetical protein
MALISVACCDTIKISDYKKMLTQNGKMSLMGKYAMNL